MRFNKTQVDAMVNKRLKNVWERRHVARLALKVAVFSLAVGMFIEWLLVNANYPFGIGNFSMERWW